MTAVDRFVEDVCVVTAETADFLIEPLAGVFPQVAVTLIPQLVPVRERAWHALACGLENVFTHDVGVDWWQFPVPVNALAIAGRHRELCRRAR
jgi:hypothetical protein